MLPTLPYGRSPVLGAAPRRRTPGVPLPAAVWSFQPGAGLLLPDAGPARLHGTLSGATWRPGPGGGALDFDGTDAWVSMGDVLDPRTGDVTLAILARWVGDQPELYSGHRYGVLGGKGALGVDAGYSLYAYDTGVNFQARSAALNAACVGPAGLNDGRWRLITGVLDRDDAAGLRLYVDGQLAASADPTPFAAADLDSTAPFALGSHTSGGAWSFDLSGAIAGAWFWPSALPDRAIAAHARDPWGMFRQPRRTWVFGPFAPAWPTDPDLVTLSALVAAARDYVTYWPSYKQPPLFVPAVNRHLDALAQDADAAAAWQEALAAAETSLLASAAVSATPSAPGSDPAYLHDEDADTAWQSGPLPAIIDIDLGSPHLVSRLVLLTRSAVGAEWELRACFDSDTYVRASGTLSADTTEVCLYGGPLVEPEDPVQRWRLTFTAAPAGSITLVEIGLYGESAP